MGMNNFSIYCSEEQTKKALCLGAPIEEDYRQYRDIMFEEECMRTERQLLLPTAEQMIGWLEEKGVLVDINPINGLHFYWILRTKELDEGSGKYIWESQYITPERDLEYDSRKEAILAAIDAALDYLEKHKK